jgi:hypothetical protein
MKSGRQCRDCHITIHKKCEEKFNSENICTREPVHVKLNPILSPSDDDLKNMVNIELTDGNNTPTIITTTDEIETNIVKPTELLVSIPTNTRPTPPATITTTTTTANRLHTKAAAAFSALDSTARRSFRAFGHRHLNQQSPSPTTSLAPSLVSTSELSTSDESLHNPSIKKPPVTPSPVPTSSKLVNAASSAYSKLRELKSKRLSVQPETNPVRKHRLPSDTSKFLSSLFPSKFFSFSTQ